jgi:hypothetical protein
VKTYRWLTLVAALLITVCEVGVFNSQAARAPQKQATAAAAADGGSGTDTHLSLAGIASLYWAVAASDARSPDRVR